MDFHRFAMKRIPQTFAEVSGGMHRFALIFSGTKVPGYPHFVPTERTELKLCGGGRSDDDVRYEPASAA
jgi:hypothetical protein